MSNKYDVHWQKTYWERGITRIEANDNDEAEAIAYENMGDYEGSKYYDPDENVVEVVSFIKEKNSG